MPVSYPGFFSCSLPHLQVLDRHYSKITEPVTNIQQRATELSYSCIRYALELWDLHANCGLATFLTLGNKGPQMAKASVPPAESLTHYPGVNSPQHLEGFWSWPTSTAGRWNTRFQKSRMVPRLTFQKLNGSFCMNFTLPPTSSSFSSSNRPLQHR